MPSRIFWMFSGIVLAGGASKRMGTDKKLMLLKNQTLLQRAVSKLKNLCEEVVVVLDDKDEPDPCMEKVRYAYDCMHGKGPLVGIYSGLQICTNDHAVVLPVDTPFVRTGLLKHLMDNAFNHEIVVPRWSRGVEPLVAVYSKGLESLLNNWINEGEKLAPHLLIEKVSDKKVKYIEEDEIKQFGKPEILFHNINTKEDLDNANKILESDYERYKQ